MIIHRAIERLKAVNAQLSPAAVFTIAFILRCLWWGAAYFYGEHSFTTYDSGQYLRLAHNLLHHGIFSQSESEPFYADVVRTPGYPLLLAFFEWLEWPTAMVALVQSVMGALVPVVVLKTAAALGARRNGWIGLLLAIDVSLIVFTPLILTDGLFTLLLALWLHSLLTARSPSVWLGTAALAGMLVLVRPSGMIVPLATAAWGLLRLGPKPLVLGVTLVSFLLPGYWVYRNYSEQNILAMSTIGPNTLYLFHAAAVKARGEQRSFNEVQSEMIEDLNRRYDWTNDRHAILNFLSFCKSESVRIYRAHPLSAVHVTGSNMVGFIAKPTRGYIDDALGLKPGYQPVTGFQADRSQSFIQRLRTNTSFIAFSLSAYQIAVLLLQTVLFLLGIKSLWRFDKRLSIMILLLFGYFWLTSAITQTDARFRMPVLPIMAVCWAALGKKEAWVTCENEKA